MKNRNNRIVIFLMLIMAFAIYLRSNVYVGTKGSSTIITSNERILYTFPKAIIDRLYSLEMKVENISSVFQKIRNLKQSNIVTSFFSNFVDENIDSFWAPDGIDKTLASTLYGNGNDNNISHKTVLIT